jgi:lipoprotein-releasing system ATP-binding protein
VRLAVDDLAFSYRRGGELVIDGLTHEFPHGAVTAVTGASGRGKSTLLYLIALMLTPLRGSITYDGRVVSTLRDGERSRLRAATVGFVFQDAVLDPSRSVEANVAEGSLYAGLAREQGREAGHEQLERFGIEHRAAHRPGEVSGGQAQRVALSRALAKQPALVLGDEPTGNLDHRSADVVWRAFVDVAARGATVVIATHDLGLAAKAHHHLELR